MMAEIKPPKKSFGHLGKIEQQAHYSRGIVELQILDKCIIGGLSLIQAFLIPE